MRECAGTSQKIIPVATYFAMKFSMKKNMKRTNLLSDSTKVRLTEKISPKSKKTINRMVK